MIDTEVAILLFSLALFLYTYMGYPTLLWAIGKVTRKGFPVGESEVWPTVSITVPAYNEERQVHDLIASLLAIDYPRDRLQILIVSDASSDGTDDIVRSYADRGIELLRMPERGGKTRAETAASARLTGEIVVNTDASIRILPGSIKPLVTVFRDPRIGLASGRDVSVSPGQSLDNLSESGYVGYEMAIRDLETQVAGIIGASGCFYAIRQQLHRTPLPDALSRDFAAALHTIEAGYRAVSVPNAVCLVPRTTSLHAEYRRKVRTITRGMETLWHKRSLLNPFRYGVFSWMLVSHKLCRWGLPWAGFASLAALAALAPYRPIAWLALAPAAAVMGLAALGWRGDGKPGVPRFVTIPAFVVAGNVAAAAALLRSLHGHKDPTWEPTRREPTGAAPRVPGSA